MQLKHVGKQPTLTIKLFASCRYTRVASEGKFTLHTSLIYSLFILERK